MGTWHSTLEPLQESSQQKGEPSNSPRLPAAQRSRTEDPRGFPVTLVADPIPAGKFDEQDLNVALTILSLIAWLQGKKCETQDRRAFSGFDPIDPIDVWNFPAFTLTGGQRPSLPSTVRPDGRQVLAIRA